VKFLTRIFHPNVSLHGEMDLGFNVSSEKATRFSIAQVFSKIEELFITPKSNSLYNPAAGDLLTKDQVTFERIVNINALTYSKIEKILH